MCFASRSSGQSEADFITSFHPNPLGNGPILLLFLSQESLDPESLVRRHGEDESAARLLFLFNLLF